MEIFLIIYACWLTYAWLMTIFFICANKHFLTFTVKEIYEDTNMNVIGCFFIWFIEFILNPIYWICVFIAFILFGIFIFFDFCFHVGRRNK